ncbi:MAG: LUD domain-containing protein [Candidatus Eremiobacteraeota bacterium]|nr:LUD domain-containing protein [Candidatus Eremiobacteraeota bacterium]
MSDSNAARAAILDAIKQALRDEPERALPAPAPVFADPPVTERAQLAQTFARELGALKGETIFVRGAAFMPRALGVLLTQRGFNIVAVQNSTRVSAALGNIAGDRFFQAAGASKERIAAADCGIIEADALLADTGSVVAMFTNRGERLLPYLPPACIVIADVKQLKPHMDDGIAGLYAAAREGRHGEAVIITGPSRSADIEKVLVLGAHGPSQMIVMLAGVSESGEISAE